MKYSIYLYLFTHFCKILSVNSRFLVNTRFRIMPLHVILLLFLLELTRNTYSFQCNYIMSYLQFCGLISRNSYQLINEIMGQLTTSCILVYIFVWLKCLHFLRILCLENLSTPRNCNYYPRNVQIHIRKSTSLRMKKV